MILPILLALADIPAVPTPLHVAQDEQPLPVEVWQLDQLRIDSATDAKALKAIEPAHSLDEVIATLTRLHVDYRRTNAVLLPDRLPAEIRAQILALPKGEPFVLPEGGFISISVLVARKLPPGAVRWQPHPTPFTRPREA